MAILTIVSLIEQKKVLCCYHMHYYCDRRLRSCAHAVTPYGWEAHHDSAPRQQRSADPPACRPGRRTGLPPRPTGPCLRSAATSAPPHRLLTVREETMRARRRTNTATKTSGKKNFLSHQANVKAPHIYRMCISITTER